jgi:hypothetical protein
MLSKIRNESLSSDCLRTTLRSSRLVDAWMSPSTSGGGHRPSSRSRAPSSSAGPACAPPRRSGTYTDFDADMLPAQAGAWRLGKHTPHEWARGSAALAARSRLTVAPPKPDRRRQAPAGLCRCFRRRQNRAARVRAPRHLRRARYVSVSEQAGRSRAARPSPSVPAEARKLSGCQPWRARSDACRRLFPTSRAPGVTARGWIRRGCSLRRRRAFIGGGGTATAGRCGRWRAHRPSRLRWRRLRLLSRTAERQPCRRRTA